ncbi:MAG: hypothetical protein ACTII7_02350 [Galactobacter sp.]
MAAGPAGEDIVQQAWINLYDLESVTVKTRASADGDTTDIEVSGSLIEEGDYRFQSNGTEDGQTLKGEIVRVNRAYYATGNEPFLAAFMTGAATGPDDPALKRLVKQNGDKYLPLTSSEGNDVAMPPGELLNEVFQDITVDSLKDPRAAGVTADVAGSSAYGYEITTPDGDATLYVSADGSEQIVGLSTAEGSDVQASVELSGHNEPVAIADPTKEQTVSAADLKRYFGS